jgi:NADPH:quinone reductase-like Zn-dependent oxidoreductase
MLRTSRAPGKKVICALSAENPKDLIFIRELVEAGKIKSIIDRCYTLEQTAEAHRHVEKGCKTGSVIITVENNNKKEDL